METTQAKAKHEEWNPACRGALKSALACRQYPQTRVFAAVWSVHNRCILCLHDIVQADLVKNARIPCIVETGSNGTQARGWCSHEGGNATSYGNSGGSLSIVVLDRPLIASAEADIQDGSAGES